MFCKALGAQGEAQSGLSMETSDSSNSKRPKMTTPMQSVPSRFKKGVALVAAVALAGCATAPANVPPTYVSSMRYDSADCKQLSIEAEEVDARLQAVSGTLQTKANGDAALVTVGAIIFWPALLALAATGGKPEEAEVGRLKGEAMALVKAAKAKGCDIGLPATGVAAPAAPPTSASAAPVR
jgi:hypothetical protein